MLVTRFGVSVLKVVATIETPTSHHGAARPEVKNSAVLDPARLAKKMAGRKEMTMLAAMIAQSRDTRCMRAPGVDGGAGEEGGRGDANAGTGGGGTGKGE